MVVWSIASHHPERCFGVANLCVPYLPEGFAPQTIVPLVDRRVYPESEYPVGQWDYQLFYQERFDTARAQFEAHGPNTLKVLFRKGNPEGRGEPSRTATVRWQGGWFSAAGQAPDVPRDDDVIGEVELQAYVAALERNGLFGPDSWYMNHEQNLAYAARSVNGGRLDLPVLFLHGRYDYTCETIDSSLAEPMRRSCSDLTEVVVDSGHWMEQEQPVAVNAALARWMAARLPQLWPVAEAAPP
jgi:pimeloyl-ACP methyl ester carboxylesterase